MTLVANIGVFAGIVFLAYEIRVNTDAVNRTAFQELMNSYSDITSIIISREGAALLSSGFEGLDNLDEIDRIRLFNLAARTLAHLQNAHEQWLNGFVNDRQWRQLSSIAVAFFNSQSSHQVWKSTKDRYSTEFQAWVEEHAITSSFTPPWEEAGPLS